jgi:hypothetical protein
LPGHQGQRAFGRDGEDLFPMQRRESAWSWRRGETISR